MVQNYEYSQEQIKSIRNHITRGMCCKSRSENRDTGKTYKTGHSTRPTEPRLHSDASTSHESSKPECLNCGYKHTKKEKRPAHGNTCKLCIKRNHFARVLRRSKKVCDPHCAEYTALLTISLICLLIVSVLYMMLANLMQCMVKIKHLQMLP